MLADFFVEIYKEYNIRFIIETHSEYIINRLRYRIAQAKENNLSNISSLFFISKKQGVSDFKNVTISEYGGITDWPKDFFDQTQHEVERILLAGITKKRANKKQPEKKPYK